MAVALSVDQPVNSPFGLDPGAATVEQCQRAANPCRLRANSFVRFLELKPLDSVICNCSPTVDTLLTLQHSTMKTSSAIAGLGLMLTTFVEAQDSLVGTWSTKSRSVVTGPVRRDISELPKLLLTSLLGLLQSR